MTTSIFRRLWWTCKIEGRNTFKLDFQSLEMFCLSHIMTDTAIFAKSLNNLGTLGRTELMESRPSKMSQFPRGLSHLLEKTGYVTVASKIERCHSDINGDAPGESRVTYSQFWNVFHLAETSHKRGKSPSSPSIPMLMEPFPFCCCGILHMSSCCCCQTAIWSRSSGYTTLSLWFKRQPDRHTVWELIVSRKRKRSIRIFIQVAAVRAVALSRIKQARVAACFDIDLNASIPIDKKTSTKGYQRDIIFRIVHVCTTGMVAHVGHVFPVTPSWP